MMLQLFWHVKVRQLVDRCRSSKERFRLYFQGSEFQLFDSFALKDRRTIFLRNFIDYSNKITASIPRRPESPETSLGLPQISPIPALSLQCLQQLTLILTALLSQNVLRISVRRGKMTNMKPVQIAISPPQCPSPMPPPQCPPPHNTPHVLVDFVAFPPGHGRSVTDF